MSRLGMPCMYINNAIFLRIDKTKTTSTDKIIPVPVAHCISLYDISPDKKKQMENAIFIVMPHPLPVLSWPMKLFRFHRFSSKSRFLKE